MKMLLSLFIVALSPGISTAAELMYFELDKSRIFETRPARMIHELQIKDFIDNTPYYNAGGECVEWQRITEIRNGEPVPGSKCIRYSWDDFVYSKKRCNTETPKIGKDGPGFVIVHDENPSLLANLKIISKGQYYKSGVPDICRKFDSTVGSDGAGIVIDKKLNYVHDSLHRRVRLEDLRLGSVSMNFNRFEKRTGLGKILMSGSRVNDEYLELVESKVKNVILDWQSTQSLDDYFNLTVDLHYDFSNKKWIFEKWSPLSYHWVKEFIFFKTTIKETEDSLYVTIKNVTKLSSLDLVVEHTWDAHPGYIVFNSKLLTLLSQPKLGAANFSLYTRGFAGSGIGSKTYDFKFENLDHYVKQGIVKIIGNEILFPGELLEKNNPKFKRSFVNKRFNWYGKFVVDSPELPYALRME